MKKNLMSRRVTMHKHGGFRLPLIIPCILVVSLLHISSVNAEKQKIVLSNDTRYRIEFEEFGFTSSGHVSFNVSSVSIATTNKNVATNSSRIGLVLVPIFSSNFPMRNFSYDAILRYNATNHTFEEISFDCLMDNPRVVTLFTLSDLSPPPQSSLSKTIQVKVPGGYGLDLANCVHGAYISSMAVELEVYNVDKNGRKDYLSDGESPLPMLFFIFSFLYIPFLFVWWYRCHKNKAHVKKIHVLMGVLLVVKALDLMFASEDKYHVKVTGAPRGWDVWFYAFQFIRGMLFFIITVLIGTGWSFVRPYLQKKEKILLMIGIPLQVLDNIVYLILVELAPSSKNYDMDFSLWLFGLMGMDIVIFLLIAIPISWSMKTLRDTGKMDGKAVANLKKMNHFANIYFLVFVYTLFSKMILYAVKIGRPMIMYDCWWVGYGFYEGVAICFYIGLFYVVRPMKANQYLVVAANDEEEKQALAQIQSREFDELIFDNI